MHINSSIQTKQAPINYEKSKVPDENFIRKYTNKEARRDSA